MRFLFACGGTAGHVNPAVGVAGRIRELLPDSEILFIGASAILLLFAMLIVRGYWISLQSTDRFSFLTGCGITTMLALQIVLNVAVCTNLVPCTGISLPFFSYGGTALLMQLGEMGIILSISRDIPTKKAR